MYWEMSIFLLSLPFPISIKVILGRTPLFNSSTLIGLFCGYNLLEFHSLNFVWSFFFFILLINIWNKNKHTDYFRNSNMTYTNWSFSIVSIDQKQIKVHFWGNYGRNKGMYSVLVKYILLITYTFSVINVIGKKIPSKCKKGQSV